MSPDANLAALLEAHPFADHEVLLTGPSGALTAGEARSQARALAERLRALGVGEGRAVAVARPNDASYIVAMFAIWLAGAVFVPLNRRAPQAERDQALAATGPAALIDEHGVTPLEGARAFDPGVAFVLWTSGTTGRPKPVLHTHTAYLELLDRVLTPLRGPQAGPTGPRAVPAERRPSPNLIPVSLALNAGIYNVLFGLRAGAAVVVMDRFTPQGFAALVARHGVRSTVLPPAAITMLNDADDVTGLAPLRFVRSITAPLSALQARRFTAKFGVTVLNGYGQAEIGEVIGWTAADARDHPQKVGAVGRAHPGVQVRIDRADPAGVGRLWVRPPAMAAGYATGGELRDRMDDEGFVDTGDLARIDEAGFVWIEGRAGDLVNRGGNKVFPEQVEEVLRLVPGVVDAAVVGRPDRRLGEVPVALVVTDRAVDDRDLDAMCRAHLVAYKVPVAFLRADGLPRNEAGKLLRRDLAAQVPAEAGTDEREGPSGR